MDIPLLLAMIVLLCFSGFFSASETAFNSANRVRLKSLAQDKNKQAKKVLKLLDNYPRFLSTVLVGNNIVNITLSSVATLFFIDLIKNSSVATVVSTVVTTVVVLIFGEVTPKTLAKETPEKFAMFSVGFLSGIQVIFTPVNFLFDCWNNMLLKLFKVKSNNTFTEDDLLNIVDEAENVGGIGENEGQIIRSAIEFTDLDVQDVLTPRVDVIAVDLNETKEDIFNAFRSSGFSRLPIYKGTIDNILGIINQKDFYEQVMLGNKTVRGIVKPVKMVTPFMKISDLMKILQSCKSHMAVVLDEYGGTLGIVTLEDILEELVGEIWDERDVVNEEIVQLSENEYRVSGTMATVKLFSLLNVDEEDDEEIPATLAGLVMRETESIPEEGQLIHYKNLDVTVEKIENSRIETLLVKHNESPEAK